MNSVLNFNRKGSYDSYTAANGYYDGGDEDWEAWGEAAEGYELPYDPGVMGYHAEYTWTEDYAESIEVDFLSMVFSLSETLEPQDLYHGFSYDEKSFLIVLDDGDIEDQSPLGMRSRPLKIHPEPSEVKVALSPVPSFATDADALASSGAPTGSPPKSPPASSINGSPLSRRKDSEVPAGSLNLNALLSRPDSGDDVLGSPGASESKGAFAAGSQSPKIVISNSQLEHLKLKMQALKQRRGDSSVGVASAPPAVMGASSVAMPTTTPPRRTSSQSLRSGPPKLASNCPGNHGLMLFSTETSGWWCSVCEKEHPKGAAFYGCRECDYDECERCATAGAPSDKASDLAEKSPLTKSPREGSTKSSKMSPRGTQTPPRDAGKDDQIRLSPRLSSPQRSRSAPRLETRKKRSKAERAADRADRAAERAERAREKPQLAAALAVESRRSRDVVVSRDVAGTSSLASSRDRRGDSESCGSSSEEPPRPRREVRGSGTSRRDASKRRLTPRRRETRTLLREAPVDHSHSSSEEPPPKKHLAPGTGATSSRAQVSPGGALLKASSSSSILRASNLTIQGRNSRGRGSVTASGAGEDDSPEPPPRKGAQLAAPPHRRVSGDTAPPARPGQRPGGDDLLRRVLRAAAGNKQGQAKAAGPFIGRPGSVGGGASAAVISRAAEDSPPPTSASSAAAGAARTSPPSDGVGRGGPSVGIRKALVEFASQGGERKSRRV